MRRLLRPALALAVIAALTRVDPVLGVVVLLGGWAFASWWLPGRAVEGLTGERVVVDRAMFGESVEVKINLRSRYALPWLHLTDSIPFNLGSNTRWVTSLGRNDSAVHIGRFTASARGLHRIGPAVVATGDVFGLRRVQKTVIPHSTLLVYPRIVPIETLTVAAGAPLPLIPTRTPLYDDPTRIVGVREYQAGDPFRKIHWTASAVTGDLLVKKHRPAIARDVMVAVDLTRDSHPSPGRRRSAELAVTAAASISHHLVTQRHETVALRIVGKDAPTGEVMFDELTSGRDQGHLANLLERLARAEISASTDNHTVLEAVGLPFGSSIVLLTGVISRRHVLDAMRLLRIGVAVTVIVTASDQHRGPWEPEIEELGIPLRSVSRLAEMIQL